MAVKNSNQVAFWQQHLEKFRGSGLSRGAYCREHGLKAHQLSYQLDRGGKTKAASKAAFARVVTTAPASEATGTCAARLIFGGGISLEVSSGADPAWMARLIAHVGGRP